ncbi:putative zinc-binding peptidase [Pollutibacter soli]|uniref:zinc-binding metallopeptidase family protein n=1 Tax=Pollutibacter soli TaxID=3034157 RepID=UPI00301386B8
MKLYTCSNCNNLLYFENSVCLNCNHAIGFDAESLSMIALVPSGDNLFSETGNASRRFRYCSNFAFGTCNWIIPENADAEFCKACELNHTIPDLSIEQNQVRWKKIEIAKHRLVFSLLRLQLPMDVKVEKEDRGIWFDFLADEPEGERVTTGHDSGIITLNIEEADDDVRMRNLMNLGERYRTLLGHFRHEIGHYYWELLINNQSPLEKFRELFGDERADYGKALEKYYQQGLSFNWMNEYISPYATAHPWEDWAETWSHYLHMMDTLETAYYFSIRVRPRPASGEELSKASVKEDPYEISDFNQIMQLWLPLSFAVNSLNRSMGHQDFYPFVISPKVVEKLAFIHEVVRSKEMAIRRRSISPGSVAAIESLNPNSKISQ